MISSPVFALMTQTTQMRSLLGKLVPKSYLFPAPYVTVITEIKQLIQGSKLTKAALLSVLDPAGQANILHVAVLYHDIPFVEWLLQQGAKVTCCNTKGETPLHWAVKEKQHEMMHALLMEEAIVDQTDFLGRTPLHWAAQADKFFASLLLLEHGANPLMEDFCLKTPLKYFDKYCFLHVAIEKKDVKRAALLLKAGVYVNLLDQDGIAALHLAIQRRSLKCITLLLEYGACAKQVGSFFEKYQFLHRAVVLNDARSVRALLKAGVCINAQDDCGNTPLFIAANAQFLEMVALLLEYGALAHLPNYARKTALQLFKKHQFLHQAVKRGNEALVRLLFKMGVAVNAKDGAGRTPLYLAAEQENLEMAALLLDYGADLEMTDINGISPRNVLERKGLCDALVLLGLEQLECSSLSASPVAVQFSSVSPLTAVRQTRSEQLPAGLVPPTGGGIQRSRTVYDLTMFGLD